MPVEFALRPRIRLREDSPRPRRSRVRVPRFALPVALYWVAAGGITYAFVHEHAAPPPASGTAEEASLAAEPAPGASRPWWPLAPEPAAHSEAAARNVETITAPAQPDARPEATPSAPAAPEPALTEAAPAQPEPAAQPERAATPDTVDSRAISRALASRLSEPLRPPRATQPSQPSRMADLAPLATLDAPAPASTAPPREAAPHRGLPSCEAALESAHQDVDFSQGNGTADLPTSVIAAVLENGAWLSSCGVPASTSLDVCVAIRGGSVIGASVTSRPANAEIADCVRRRAGSLQFPFSSHVDIARTRF